MKRTMIAVFALALVSFAGDTRAQPGGDKSPDLLSHIVFGVPFRVALFPGHDNGTLIGGQTYFGQYNSDTGGMTIQGPARDGFRIETRSVTHPSDPREGQLSLWGAAYSFDAAGNVYNAATGQHAGKLTIRR